MSPKRRTWLVVTAPLVAIATLMIGLRVGAGDEFHAALIYVAAPSKPGPDGATTYAWQIMTYLEDRGVRETIAMKDLSATARTFDGQEAHWEGESNADGIAEVSFAFAKTPAKIGLEVRKKGEKEPLALGIIDINDAPIPQHASPQEVDHWGLQPSQKSGVPLQVFVEGESIAVGVKTSVWVRLPPPAKSVHAASEVGVDFDAAEATPVCDDWVELHATALGQTAGATLEARDAQGAVVGKWYGLLPTAPGAFEVITPRVVTAGDTLRFIAPNPRTTAYVEVDDEQGREFGAVLPLAVREGSPMPQTELVLPKTLLPGRHWLVVSGNPRGAEKMSGATLARSFVLGSKDEQAAAATPEAQCRLGVEAAHRVATGFPRVLAIDGIATRGAKNRARHRQGLFIGLLALAAASLLEVLLLTAAAREARHALELAQNENAEQMTRKPAAGGLVVALLVAVLGFALLAALMIAKA